MTETEQRSEETERVQTWSSSFCCLIFVTSSRSLIN